MQKLELLCPAGSWESMVAAVQNGADAVYLGSTAFSARASAANFDNQQLKDAVVYCHLRGVRVYVTLNTLVKQDEMEGALETAKLIYFTGADALILQDIGLASIISKTMPDIALYASTQMTVHNVAGAKMLENMGFKCVVLSRELSKAQIRHIAENTDMNVEIFAHGALCFSYSGQCLFSSILGGRSGNRGRCAQPCRLPYTLKDGKGNDVRQGYLLSPKDLCLASELGEISNMGVQSIKIEGRLKRPEYVAAVTGIYRKYIDNPGKVSVQDTQTLLNAFNRSGFTKAYFSGETGQSMMSHSTPTNTASEHFAPDITATFASNANFRKIDIQCDCVFRQGESAVIRIKDSDGNEAECFGAIVQKGIDACISKQRIEEQLSKFGSTPFNLTRLDVYADEDIATPIKEINALRRNAVEKLYEIRIRMPDRRMFARDKEKSFTCNRSKNHTNYAVEVSTLEQAEAVAAYHPIRIYAPIGLTEQVKALNYDGEIVTKMPDIIHDDFDMSAVLGMHIITGVPGMAQNRKDSGNTNIYGDFRLNVYNAYTADVYKDMGFKSVTLSPELNLKEIAKLCSKTDVETEVIVYGHIPLMLTKHCIIKACAGKCVKGKSNYYLKDRKGERIAVVCDPISCTNTLLNSKPIYMADKMADIWRSGVETARLVFTTETAKACAEVMQQYMNSVKIETDDKQNNFTRGHFYRGVE